MKFRTIALALTLAISNLTVFANNPIENFSIEMTDQGTMGDFFNNYEVMFVLELDTSITIDSYHCKIESEDFENPIIDIWVNEDGSNNGGITITTDSQTGERIINLGVLEIPLSYTAKIKAKDNNGVEHEIVLPF